MNAVPLVQPLDDRVRIAEDHPVPPMRCRAQSATAMFDGMAKFSQVVGVPLVAVPLVWFGWRGAFWMTAGLSFLFLIVFWISYRDPSEDAHLSPVERDYILAGGARPRVRARPPRPQSRRRYAC